MQSFVMNLLICTITMSALSLFYIAVMPLFAKRYSDKSRYYAWLFIVLGFIIPFRAQLRSAIVKVEITIEAMAPVVKIGNYYEAFIGARNTPLPVVSPSVSIWQIMVVVWMVGMIVFLMCHAIKHYRFMKMVKRWSDVVMDEQAVALYWSLKSEMGINKRIDLFTCSCIGSPMLVGFWKPRILIPNLKFYQDELSFILKHELIHFKRKDLWYKSLVLVATAMHWFNPVVYLMAKEIDVLCELSCDADVVQRTNADIRQKYSETIIGVLRYRSKMNTVLSTNFYGGKKGMKKRIFSIMDMGKKKAGLALISSSLLITVFMAIFLTSCSTVSFTGSKDGDESHLIMNYSVMNMELSHMLTLEKDDVIDFEVVNETGKLSIVVQKDKDRPVYTGNKLPTGSFSVTVPESGKYKVSVTGDNAKGSVSAIKRDSN